MELLVATLVSGLLAGAIYALAGLGFSVLYRSTKLLNLAYGEQIMLGSLVGYTLVSDWGWPLLVAGPVAVAVAAASGVLIDLVFVRHMRSPDPLRVAVMTFGLALVIHGIARIMWGTNIYSLPVFPGAPTSFSVFYDRAVLSGQAIYVVAGLVLVALAVFLMETRTRMGWMMRAVGVDAPMARTLGIPAGFVIAGAFAISGAIAGLTGFLTLPVIFMTAGGGTLLGLKGLVAAVVGGFDRRFGAVVGGLLLGLLEQASVAYLGAGWQDAVVFVVLIAALLFRPQGLLVRRVA